MKVKKKLKSRRLSLIIIALLLITVILSIEAMNVMAAPLTWETIWYRGDCDLRTVSAWSLRDDCVECGWNQTLNAKADGPIYSGTNHFFDNVVVGDSSRAMYAKRLTVSNGMTISIVAAQEDTADEGGITYIKGNNTGDNLYFYWSIGEYDANGNVLFDGDWRGVNESWTVGKEANHASYGASGYPLGVSQADRESRVNCIMPVFRWAKGGLNVGGGSEYPFKMSKLKETFPIIQLVTKPFTYTFNYNDGSGKYTTIERLGINNVSVPATPQRAGYVFTGWKITSTGGKQAGKVYDAGQLAEMFSDSKYYSSLFENATFEAQWANADQFVSYMGNGADNMSDYYKSYAASYSENKYDDISFTKTGYTAESNWEARDKMNNYWFSTAGDGTSKMLQLSGATTIRSKLNVDCTIDVNEGSLQNGANVQTWGCLYNAAQMFVFQYVKTENGIPYWAIRNTYSGKVLDLALNTGAGGGNDGANVQMYTYHGGDNQLWTLEMAGDGYFYIRSKLDNNLVLDLWGNEAGNGKNIAVSKFHGGDNQKWMLCDNSINLYANWKNNNYRVSYDADGGTLYDDSGNETMQNVKTYEYDKSYSFFTAKRDYTVNYETNGGTATIETENTNAQAIFNGWNENLDKDTNHGIVDGTNAYTTGTWNWAAYLNGNPDLLNAAGNIYNTTWAIWHYRGWGSKPEENRKFNGNSYWLPSLKFRNLTANGGTVYVKANYTNGSVILPKPEKETVQNKSYVFSGWYKDSTLTEYAGAAGDSYTPDSDVTLYAKYTETDSTPVSCSVTIEHYLMDMDGNYPSRASESEVTAKKYGTELAAVSFAKEYEGYTLDLEKSEKENTGISMVVKGDMTIKLYYNRNKYTVTYNVVQNGGNWSDNSKESVTKDYYWGQAVDLTATAQKQNYEFIGWNTDSNTTTALEQFVMLQEDITLYALYSGGVTAKFVDSLGVREVTGIRYNNTDTVQITVPDIREYDWEGVTSSKIIGWNSKTDITDAAAQTNEIAQDTITISSNVTYYAVYAAEITLEYNLTGADESQQINPVTVTAYTNAYNLSNVCGEKVTLAEAVKHTLTEQEGYIDSYVQTAWAENSIEGQQYAMGSEYNLIKDTVMYAVWEGEITPIEYMIRFDGNGSTAGTMADIQAVYDQQITLPENAYTRTTDFGDSKFLGWSRTADTKTIEFSNQDIVKNLTSVNGDIIILYAIWDDCPEIEAKDRYFTLKEAQEGKITVAELLTTATAMDAEDGDITDKLTIPNTDDEEWKQFTAQGSATITYKVIDSAGNTGKKMVTVYIADTTPDIKYESNVRSAKYGYVRFINEKYYKNTPEEGGLVENSVWKTPEYAAILERAMENRRSLTYETGTLKLFGGVLQYDYTIPGSISCDHVSQLWKFTREDRNKIKDYVQEHGLGKYKEQGALNGFMDEFGYCRQE